MKAAGIVRNLDNLGRVVIPKEMRNLIGIKEGGPVEIVKMDNEVIIKKYSKGCIFCGNNEGVSKFRDTLICDDCKNAIKHD